MYIWQLFTFSGSIINPNTSFILKVLFCHTHHILNRVFNHIKQLFSLFFHPLFPFISYSGYVKQTPHNRKLFQFNLISIKNSIIHAQFCRTLPYKHFFHSSLLFSALNERTGSEQKPNQNTKKDRKNKNLIFLLNKKNKIKLENKKINKLSLPVPKKITENLISYVNFNQIHAEYVSMLQNV